MHDTVNCEKSVNEMKEAVTLIQRRIKDREETLRRVDELKIQLREFELHLAAKGTKSMQVMSALVEEYPELDNDLA